jgi:hypothetical protein
MLWRDAVLQALHRFSIRHETRLVERQPFIEEELARIVSDAEARGETPSQTLSRVLQELRDEGILYFTGGGKYLLADTPMDMEAEELPDDAIDFAISSNKLLLGVVPVDEAQAIVRRRKGQARVRALALRSYNHQCGLCDIRDDNLLVASHIVRWADEPLARGNLCNVICLCRLHDPLFEAGYFAITDTFDILRRRDVASQIVLTVLRETDRLRLPKAHQPSPEFLRKHRIRTGFEKL